MQQKIFGLLFAFSVSNTLFAVTPTYLSKTFLLKVTERLAEGKNEPLKVFSFYSPREKEFVEKTHGLQFTDIQAPVQKFKKGQFFNYNMIYQRSAEQKISDHESSERIDCRMVYTDAGKFWTHPLDERRPNIPNEFKTKTSWNFSYCVGEDHQGDKERLLYYFHGASGNPTNFIERRATAEFRYLWRHTGNLPRWVSVSLGRFGNFITKGKEAQFMETIVPYVEKVAGFSPQNPPKQRFGLGVSMGGANITHLTLKQPKFFAAGGLVCPAISYVDSHTSPFAFSHFMGISNAYRTVVNAALRLTPPEYSDIDYLATVDPLIMGQAKLGKDTPPLWIQGSSKDQFGFNVGNKIFAMLARVSGVDVQYEELEGPHCVLNPSNLVKFFQSHLD